MRDRDHLPERDSRWNHEGWRGPWRVKSVGPKWVTLTPPIFIHGYPNSHRVAAATWPEGWRRAGGGS